MLLHGKPVADVLHEKTRLYMEGESTTDWYVLHLLLSDDAPTRIYAKRKAAYAQSLGLNSQSVHAWEWDIERVLAGLRDAAEDDACVGIITQLPVAPHLRPYLADIFSCLPWYKDLDGLSGHALWWSLAWTGSFLPATPRAVVEVYDFYDLPSWSWLHVLIIWQSTLTGAPLAVEAIRRWASVMSANVTTDRGTLSAWARSADIVISATGVEHLVNDDFFTAWYAGDRDALDMILQDKILLDVGWWVRDGKAIGDIDWRTLQDKVRAITPVPWGIWPVTIASVFDNIRVLRDIYTWKKPQ